MYIDEDYLCQKKKKSSGSNENLKMLERQNPFNLKFTATSLRDKKILKIQ